MLVFDKSLRDKFVKLLDKDNFVVAEHEDAGMKGILPYIIQSQGYEVALYGASLHGYSALCWFKSKNIEPLCMVDADKTKCDTKFFGVDVVHIDSLCKKIKGKKVYAFVCTDAWKNFEDRFAINKALRSSGCDEILQFPSNVSDGGYWSMYYKIHNAELVCLYDELCDYESQTVLYEYLRSKICDRGYSGTDVHPTEEKYFASDIFKWRDDEYFVDCGAYIGDTIFFLIRTKRSFEKIYAIEPEWNSVMKAKEMVKMLPEQTSKKIEFFNVLLGDTPQGALDVILKDRKVTLLKTDLEGADLAALKGAKGIISKQTPVLAISMYHKKEDFVEIPAFIKSISADYKLYLRKYYPGGKIYTSGETVLYAVPKARTLSLSDS
jgi:hypothetical protein